MYISNTGVSKSKPQYLPIGFEQALSRINESDGFAEAVSFAAEQAGCEFLFEVPGMLFDQESGRAAVIRYQWEEKVGLSNSILYIIFDGDDGVIRILEEFEVPAPVQRMTQSYSRVLELLGSKPDLFEHRIH